jgi:hypothetical protein
MARPQGSQRVKGAMSIWNKVLLGFIFVASVGFFYMATRTLATHQAWQQAAQGFQKALDQARQEEEVLREGDSARMGIRQLRLALHKLTLARGRAWYHTMPQGQPDPNTGQVMVSIDVADPDQKTGISDKMTLYVFEEEQAKDGGQYLGEFKVDGVAEDERKVTLKPVFNLARTIVDPEGKTRKTDQRKLDRLVQSKGPWSLYETMPTTTRSSPA